jgi:hypothetical protein
MINKPENNGSANISIVDIFQNKTTTIHANKNIAPCINNIFRTFLSFRNCLINITMIVGIRGPE